MAALCKCGNTREAHRAIKLPVEWEWRCECGEFFPDLRGTKVTCHRCGRSCTREPYKYANCNALWCECASYSPVKTVEED